MQTRQVPTMQNHQRPILLLVGLALLTLVSKIGDALAPLLLANSSANYSPLLLLMLNANDLHLALTSQRVGFWPWLAVGLLRRLAEDPLCFALGWRYRDDGLRWLCHTFPDLNVPRTQAWFRKASYLAIIVEPGLLVCMLAGATRVKPATFALLNVAGTGVRLLAIRFCVGSLLPSYMGRILELLQWPRVQATLLALALVQALLSMRPLLRGWRSSSMLTGVQNERKGTVSAQFSRRRIDSLKSEASTPAKAEADKGTKAAEAAAAAQDAPTDEAEDDGTTTTATADEDNNVDATAAAAAATAAASDSHVTELRRLWRLEVRPRFEASVRDDPLFATAEKEDALLVRFLNAERRDAPRKPATWVPKAVKRLEETSAFRRDYCCRDFHRRGMARRLMMHATNPGATIYFGDMGLRTADGGPVLVGRVSLMIEQSKPLDAMRAAQHLRAGVFVAERALAELPPGVKGSYILDVGSFPKIEMASYGTQRYWDADSDSPNALPADGVGVEPHLPGHDTLSGLSVLREAMRLMAGFYPETLHRIFFYRPSRGFRLVFAVFRLWATPSTRSRFVLVREGQESIFFAPSAQGGCALDRAAAPRDFGGDGPSLDGDRFLALACQRYDATATLDADGKDISASG